MNWTSPSSSPQVGARAAIRLGVLAALLVTLVAPAAADSGKSKKSTKSKDKQAIKVDREYRRLYRKGRDFFDRKRWKAARKQYQKALKLREEPILYFNIGSTYRREGNAVQAIFFYQRYLDEAPKDAPYRSSAKSAIAEMEAEVEAKKARTKDKGDKPKADKPKADKPEKSVATPQPLPPRRDNRGKPNRALQITGVALVVLGAGGLGFGGYQANEARKKADELNNVEPMTPWTPDLEDTFNAGQSADTNAKIFTAVGGVAVISGVVLLLVGGSSSKPADKPVAVTPHVGRDSMGVTLRASF